MYWHAQHVLVARCVEQTSIAIWKRQGKRIWSRVAVYCVRYSILFLRCCSKRNKLTITHCEWRWRREKEFFYGMACACVQLKRRLEMYERLFALLCRSPFLFENFDSAFCYAALHLLLLLLSDASLNLNTEFESVSKHWDFGIVVCYRAYNDRQRAAWS